MAKVKTLRKPTAGAYNDEAYIDRLTINHELPHIYTEMNVMLKTYCSEPEPALDLGSCIGIIAAMNVLGGRSKCFGVEGNPHDYQRSVESTQRRLEDAAWWFAHKGWHWKGLLDFRNIYVGPDTQEVLENLLRTGEVTLVTARRVFPEICQHADRDFVVKLSSMFKRCGVRQILLEGRKENKNATAILRNADLEAECFSEHYQVTRKYNDVRLLELL